jgi:phosphoribosylamine-glycine ligase
MSKVLFITNDLLAPSLALKIQQEGHDIVIAQKSTNDTKNILKGTLRRIPYTDRYEYAKQSDLCIFDDNTSGEAAQWRKEGISCIGGGKDVIKLELDRKIASDTARLCGLKIPQVFEVKDLEDAKRIIKEKGGKFCLKQMGALDSIKGLNAISKMPNSEDLISYIDFLQERWVEGLDQEFILQEKIEGAEMAISAWWNGNDFMRDKDKNVIVEENFEHKPLTNSGGESTGEMYTIQKLLPAKYSKLYSETLEKLIPLLKQTTFTGDFDVNCIVTSKGAYFLEYTPRMGCPSISGQVAMHKMPWFEFLKACADGKQIDFEYDPRWNIVCWLYTKPFPFVNSNKMTKLYEDSVDKNNHEQLSQLLSFKLSNSTGAEVLFKEKLTKEDLKNVCWDGVRWDKEKILIANGDGYVACINGQGETVDEAGKAVSTLMSKFCVAKSFWRNDFNDTNYHKSKDDLTKWGYLDAEKKKQEAEAKAEKENKEKEKQDIKAMLKKLI